MNLETLIQRVRKVETIVLTGEDISTAVEEASSLLLAESLQTVIDSLRSIEDFSKYEEGEYDSLVKAASHEIWQRLPTACAEKIELPITGDLESTKAFAGACGQDLSSVEFPPGTVARWVVHAYATRIEEIKSEVLRGSTGAQFVPIIGAADISDVHSILMVLAKARAIQQQLISYKLVGGETPPAWFK